MLTLKRRFIIGTKFYIFPALFIVGFVTSVTLLTRFSPTNPLANSGTEVPVTTQEPSQTATQPSSSATNSDTTQAPAVPTPFAVPGRSSGSDVESSQVSEQPATSGSSMASSSQTDSSGTTSSQPSADTSTDTSATPGYGSGSSSPSNGQSSASQIISVPITSPLN